MILRKGDFTKDSEQIAELLKVTFNSSKFDKHYFLWKHFENPMGQSFVLVAEEDGEILGVRCFMRWEMLLDGKQYRAIRPVDTAVHPKAQGKGLFKKLTLEGIQMLKDEYDLIFNTPNQNSLPGYLKMGWAKISKPVATYLNLRSIFKKGISFNNTKQIIGDSSDHLFLKWRYSLDKYMWAVFDDNSVIVYRMEKRKGIVFVVLVDHFFTKKDLSIYVNSVCKKEKALFYMYHKNQTTASLKSFISIKMNDIVVVSRDDKYDVLSRYDFALGDLEGTM